MQWRASCIATRDGKSKKRVQQLARSRARRLGLDMSLVDVDRPPQVLILVAFRVVVSIFHFIGSLACLHAVHSGPTRD